MSEQKQATEFQPAVPYLPTAIFGTEPGSWNYTLNSLMRPGFETNNRAYFDGKWQEEIARNALLGLGVGAGATGLYHMARKYLAQPASKKHRDFHGGPVSSDDEKKAADGPSAWSDPNYDGGSNVLGLPINLRAGAAVMGPVIAGLAGSQLVNNYVRDKKRQEAQKKIEEAKRVYEDALIGKTASHMDKAFDQYEEKKAGLGQGFGVLQGVSTLALGGLGAKLMYDMTRSRSQSEALRKAQDARARMSALPPLWVTPDAAIAIKKKKEQAESAPQEENEQRKAATA